MIEIIYFFFVIFFYLIFLTNYCFKKKLFFQFINSLIFVCLFFYWTSQYTFLATFFIFVLFIFFTYFLLLILEKFSYKKKFSQIFLLSFLWTIVSFYLNKFFALGFLFDFVSIISFVPLFSYTNNYVVLFFTLILLFLFTHINYYLIVHKTRISQLRVSFFLFIIFIIIFFVVNIVLINLSMQSNVEYNHSVKLVQGYFNNSWEWRLNHSKEIFGVYKNLSLNSDYASVVVWPEYALPTSLENNNYHNRLLNLSKNLNSTLIVGHVTHKEKFHYDSASVFSRGNYVGTYHSNSPFILNEQTLSGNKLFTFTKKNITYGIVICNEEILPSFYKNYKKLGVDVIISLVNHQHFDNSKGEKITSNIVKSRAKDYSLFVFRSSNTGITQVISPKGKTLSALSSQKRGVLLYNYK